jgi:hypothetical protein
MNDHCGFLIHAGTVVSGVPFDFHRHRNPEAASDRMSTARIEYSPAFLIPFGIQLMQPLVKRPNTGFRQINSLGKHLNAFC